MACPGGKKSGWYGATQTELEHYSYRSRLLHGHKTQYLQQMVLHERKAKELKNYNQDENINYFQEVI